MSTTLPPIRVALVPKGIHSAETAYSFLDIVKYNRTSYVCKIFEGIPAKTFSVDDWYELCSDGTSEGAGTLCAKGAYSDTSVYEAGDIVTFDNDLYCCKTATTVGESPTTASSKWILMIQSADIEDGGVSSQF